MKTLQTRLLEVGLLLAGSAISSAAQAVWILDTANPTGIAAVTTDASGNPTATVISGDGKVSATGVYAANNGTTGFSTSPSNATWVAGSLVDYSGGGLGMNSDGSVAPNHAIDNNNLNTEAVLLHFDKSIVLSGVGLGYATSDATNQTSGPVDMSVFRWTGNGTPTGSPTPSRRPRSRSDDGMGARRQLW